MDFILFLLKQEGEEYPIGTTACDYTLNMFKFTLFDYLLRPSFTFKAQKAAVKTDRQTDRHTHTDRRTGHTQDTDGKTDIHTYKRKYNLHQ